MLFSQQDKNRLKNHLFKILSSIKGVISITLVGSFWTKKNLNDFSDVDIVIILEEFNQHKYNECINKISKINLKKFNLGNLKLLINPTFGPLKFNDHQSIVFHTMIYSKQSHIDHVIKSPFTCYDWERSRYYKGVPIKKIFPVGKIQLTDFFNSRRGVLSYLSNIEKGIISYQKYSFNKNNYALTNKKFKINRRHKIEFSYHLYKFLLINFFKFEKQINKIPNNNQIILILKKIFKKDYKFYLNHFKLLEKYKHNIDKNINSYSITITKQFVKNFINFIKKYKKNDVIFFRHAKTSLNNGTFLGVGRNPGIINKKKVKINLKKYSKIKNIIVYTSALRRATETADFISKEKYILSNDLKEKNYGKAEGFNYKQLKHTYPSIIKQWFEKKDPKFPLGENDKDLIKRINRFKKKIINQSQKIKKRRTLIIVTHNALLRCLIGDSFDIPKFMWHKIYIDHIKPIYFIIKQKTIIPNTDRMNLFKYMNK